MNGGFSAESYSYRYTISSCELSRGFLRVIRLLKEVRHDSSIL
jgi:hypothetical protein